MSCERCPCPDICLARKSFCDWAAKDPPVATEIRHICERSAVVTAPSPDYPSAGRMAVNALGALGRVVGAVATGKALVVSRDEFDRRLAICSTCDQLDASQGRCRACGCVVNLKARLESEAGKCPRKLW